MRLETLFFKKNFLGIFIDEENERDVSHSFPITFKPRLIVLQNDSAIRIDREVGEGLEVRCVIPWLYEAEQNRIICPPPPALMRLNKTSP
jgi:hypothetical protein